MYSNNIGNFQESTTILNASTKKSGNLSYAPRNCATLDYGISENVQEARDIRKLHHVYDGKPESEISSRKTKSCRGKTPQENFSGRLTLATTI